MFCYGRQCDRGRVGAWTISASFVCQAVRAVYLGRLGLAMDKLMTGGQSDIADTQRVGVAFQECFIYWIGGAFNQVALQSC